MIMDDNLTDFLDTFSKITKKPYEFLSVQEELAERSKELVKQLYDYTKSNEGQSLKNTLPQLIVNKFDEEQIWQELELQNESFASAVIQTVSQLSARKDKLNFPFKLKSVKRETEKTSVDEVLVDQEADSFENLDLSLDEENDDDEGSDLSDENSSEPVKKKVKLKPSVVDDKFFKLSELELYLQNEEKQQDKPGKEKDSFDLFINTDNEVADYKYSDFFENPDGEQHFDDIDKMESADEIDDNDGAVGDYDGRAQSVGSKKTKRKSTAADNDDGVSDGDEMNSNSEVEHNKFKKSKKVRFSLLDSDREEDKTEEERDAKTSGLVASSKKKPEKQSDKLKSSLEQRQERLGKMIERLEDEALSKKPWQLSGEVTASTRPQNSLLEEAVDFDISVRPAPVMTGEATQKLEDIILQRIKDKAWDDVERKVKPVDTPSEFKKKLALDQEKSKLSLAEVYEQEFIKQREAATADDTERQEIEPAVHVEVRNMLHSLFNKLDALSNYHYTPRPIAPEMKVVSNVAAISMEEVAPVTVAESTLLAPQEIKGKKARGVSMSKEERTDTDKKRALRLKKTKQRQRQREKVKAAKEIAKINPGLGNKYSKLKAQKQVWEVTSNNVSKMEESKDKVVRSSTTFFNKLQDEVKSQIKTKTSTFAKKKDKRNITAKKLKL